MKILILGGTGLVGRALVDFLSKENEIKAFGRGVYQNEQLLQNNVEWSDVLIQLSGYTHIQNTQLKSQHSKHHPRG